MKQTSIDKQKRAKAILKEFREKLAADRRTLKWWCDTYIPDLYLYNYVIKQISDPGSIRPDLLEAVQDYNSIPI